MSPSRHRKGFIKGEAMRMLRTNNAQKTAFEECPEMNVERSLSGVTLAFKQSALTKKKIRTGGYCLLSLCSTQQLKIFNKYQWNTGL